MKFIVTKNRLNSALSIVNRAVSSNAPIPSLSGIRIDAEDERLILTGSNSDISIRMNVRTDDNADPQIVEKGTIVIEAKYLTDIVRKMDSEKIEVEIIDGTLTRFSGNGAEFKINGYRPSEYPNIDFSVPEYTMNMNAGRLASIIESTAFAASVKETRPVLTGVNFSSDGSRIIATATDSFRLARNVFTGNGDSFNITVPAKSLNEARAIFNDGTKDLAVHLNTKKIQFVSEDIILQSRLLDGSYPETERLIPKEFRYDLVVNKQKLIGIIDRSSIMKNENMTVIRMQIKDENNITVSNRAQEIGEFNEPIHPVSYTGAPLDISFAANYAIDALRAIDSPNVRIRFTGEMKPFIITDEAGNDDVLQLVLPIRTYN
ncbi:MAG: DNA polymerase III subunit beta [Solobacterium sp.]|nr:DNA polymerase III subunit beta [Solobacterium sp.]MBQ6592304.1 DNA polymerase III subunit beta [Solobacterium sp.]